jgi:hypothetical protein
LSSGGAKNKASGTAFAPPDASPLGGYGLL